MQNDGVLIISNLKQHVCLPHVKQNSNRVQNEVDQNKKNRLTLMTVYRRRKIRERIVSVSCFRRMRPRDTVDPGTVGSIHIFSFVRKSHTLPIKATQTFGQSNNLNQTKTSKKAKIKQFATRRKKTSSDLCVITRACV